MRKVFLDNLPVKKYGNTFRIDWGNLNNSIVNFVYDDIDGQIEIINANTSSNIIKIKYNDIISEIDKTSFINSKIGRIIGVVNNRGVVKGLSDIPTTDPWMVSFFQGGIEEAGLYSSGSMKKIYPRCPDCGRIKNKAISINDIKRCHGISCVCQDNMPYPEKVIYCFLEYIKIPFIYRYTDNWTNEIDCNGIKKIFQYDFRILQNNICSDSIIEAQGSQHILKHTFDQLGGRTLEEEQYNDEQKKKCAYKNGYNEKTYFQIDCLKSNFEYIISNVLSCEIFKNIVISKNDLEKIKSNTFSNLCKTVCEFYNENQNMTAVEIARHFHIGDWSATNFLKNGASIGWCDYDPIQKIRDGAKKNAKRIFIFNENGKYICEVYGLCELLKKDNILKCNFSAECISQVLKHKRYSYKGYIFTYDKNYVHKKEECGTIGRMKCKVYCFDSNMNLICIYESPTDAERKTGINHSAICACCNGKRKIAGGYIWKYADEID